jgi:hypothetical protein
MPRGKVRGLLLIGGVAALGILALGVWAHLSERENPRDASSELRRSVPGLHREAVELQVAVHDVVEATDLRVPIRLCRSVASRRVSLSVEPGEPLGAVLESLAKQVDARVTTEEGPPGRRTLPTISCPVGNVDYLVIGPQS